MKLSVSIERMANPITHSCATVVWRQVSIKFSLEKLLSADVVTEAVIIILIRIKTFGYIHSVFTEQ
jgi:hypothetical protein